MYASWVFWWFLAEHARLPNLLGSLYGNYQIHSIYIIGEIFYVRETVENAGYDFGDVWATCVAHMRTWDFPEVGDLFRNNEQVDFQGYKRLDVQPNLSSTATIESRKTTVAIDPVAGTNAQFVSGPSELLPGPNGWNSLTLRGVASGKRVSILIQWSDGMGFHGDVLPSYLPQQQERCDEDPRFYNSVVVVHNEATGVRRYW